MADVPPLQRGEAEAAVRVGIDVVAYPEEPRSRRRTATAHARDSSTPSRRGLSAPAPGRERAPCRRAASGRTSRGRGCATAGGEVLMAAAASSVPTACRSPSCGVIHVLPGGGITRSRAFRVRRASRARPASRKTKLAGPRRSIWIVSGSVRRNLGMERIVGAAASCRGLTDGVQRGRSVRSSTTTATTPTPTPISEGRRRAPGFLSCSSRQRSVVAVGVALSSFHDGAGRRRRARAVLRADQDPAGAAAAMPRRCSAASADRLPRGGRRPRHASSREARHGPPSAGTLRR